MGLGLLAQTRIQKSVNALQDVRQLPQNLLWYNRIPLQDADEGEILARSIQQVVKADILADDATAVVRREVPITLHQLNVPNIKHGSHLNQSTLNLLLRLQNSGNVLPSDLDSVNRHIGQRLVFLERGVKAQCEAMLVGMLCDDFDYDNMGVTFSNITWGMPSDLKVTVSPTWANSTTATPIADLLDVKQVASQKYGVEYNRVTMGMADFLDVIATDEFRDMAQFYTQFLIPSGATLPVGNVDIMKNLLVRMLAGMELELYDLQTFEENSYGVRTAVRYLPAHKVLLTNSAFDNDSSIWDLANGIVTETLVGSLANSDAAGSVIGGFGGPQRGPVGYCTAPPDLNPPNITIWDVMRAFPRKIELAANACLTVG